MDKIHLYSYVVTITNDYQIKWKFYLQRNNKNLSKPSLDNVSHISIRNTIKFNENNKQ